MVYYDLWHGVELKPVVNNGTAALAFSIEGNGYGVILGTKPSDRPHNLTAFLATMRKLTAQPLSSYSAANTVLTQTINPALTTKPYSEPPTGMAPLREVHFNSL
jgi:gamma-glutamyl hercynylcysteine S-oxide synthase